MIYKNGLGLALLAFSLFMCGHADAALTRVGNKIGMKNIPITLPLDTEMRRQGVPDQCRIEAHKVLAKYILYGYDDHPDLKPVLDIVCDFTPLANIELNNKDAEGFNGKKLGLRGKAGGLSYLFFRSEAGSMERFIVRGTEHSLKEPLECKRNGVCIGLSDGGRRTVIDPSYGPIRALDVVPDKKSETRGGIFASLMDKTKSKKHSFFWSAGISTSVLGREYRTSSEFGYRIHPIDGKKKFHGGLDIAAPLGTPILAYDDGIVRDTYWDHKGGGNVVEVVHADGRVTKYLHMQSLSPIPKGTHVKAGDRIGSVGSTGKSSGPHLHFATYEMKDGQLALVNPLDFPAPSGKPVTLSPEELSIVGTRIAATDIAMELFSDGGADGDYVPSMYCITGVSPATSVEDCQTNVNIKRAQDAAKGKTPANE